MGIFDIFQNKKSLKTDEDEVSQNKKVNSDSIPESNISNPTAGLKTGNGVCPNCGSVISHSYSQFIEITKDNQHLKQRLLKERGRFFESACPKCGTAADFIYPLQYIDIEKKINIYLLPVGHPDENLFFDHIEEFNTRSGFVTRLVADGNELVDKIDIFESGLDDRVVELCKVLMWGDLCEQQPQYRTAKCDTKWFHHSTTNKKYENAVMYGYELDGKRNSIALQLTDNYYLNIYEHFAPIFPFLQERTFEEVNEKWAYEAIDIFKQQNNKQKKHILHTRSEIDLALDTLAKSAKEYENPPKFRGMCYSLDDPDTVINFQCSKCGSISSLETYEGNNPLHKCFALTKEFKALGYCSEFYRLCDSCVDKYYPSENEWIRHQNKLVFMFKAKETDENVYSFPLKEGFIAYDIALSFLNGATTIAELSEETNTKLDAEEYIKHIKNIVGTSI